MIESVKFNRLSKREKVTVVVQDVLENIRQLRFKSHSLYINPKRIDVFDVSQVMKECDVCALGGIFLCYVMNRKNPSELINEALYGREVTGNFVKKTLLKIFDKRTIETIERFFECFGQEYINIPPEVQESMISLREKLDIISDREAVRYICETILKKGEFHL